MNIESSGPQKVSSTIEHAMAEIARDNDETLCRLALSNNDRLIEMAIKLGEAQAAKAAAIAVLADKDREIDQLRAVIDDLQRTQEFAEINPANELAA